LLLGKSFKFKINMTEQIKFIFENNDKDAAREAKINPPTHLEVEKNFEKERKEFISSIEKLRGVSPEIAERLEWTLPHLTQGPGAYLHPLRKNTAVIVLPIGQKGRKRLVSLFFQKTGEGENLNVRKIRPSKFVSDLNFKIARAQAINLFSEQQE